jgi:hypothetical protein
MRDALLPLYEKLGSNDAERKRTLVLGVAATVLVVVLGVRFAVQSLGGGTTDVVVAERPGSSNVQAPPPAPGSGELGALEAHYKPILDADPFKEHTFTRRSKGGGRSGRSGGGPDGGDDVATPTSGSSSSSSDSLALRITGIVYQAQGAYAVAEDRSTGKGLFLRKGDKFGAKSVADVGSNTVFLTRADAATPASASLTFQLGDKLDLSIADVSTRLTTLGPAFAMKDSSTGQLLPTLTADQQESVLEKMRKKRQQSIGNSGK